MAIKEDAKPVRLLVAERGRAIGKTATELPFLSGQAFHRQQGAGSIGKRLNGLAMRASPECERRDHRGHFRPDVMRCDQELRLQGAGAKRITEPAATAIPRCPRLNRAGFAFLGHGSCLPRDKRVQALCRNDSATADANGPQAVGSDMSVERSPPQAGRLAGFLDGIRDLGRIVRVSVHCLTSFAVERGSSIATIFSDWIATYFTEHFEPAKAIRNFAPA